MSRRKQDFKADVTGFLPLYAKQKKGLQSNPFMSYPNNFEPLFFARLLLRDKIKTRPEWTALMVSARHI